MQIFSEKRQYLLGLLCEWLVFIGKLLTFEFIVYGTLVIENVEVHGIKAALKCRNAYLSLLELFYKFRISFGESRRKAEFLFKQEEQNRPTLFNRIDEMNNFVSEFTDHLFILLRSLLHEDIRLQP